jgi:Bardet-Biedl syndrome 2 protein
VSIIKSIFKKIVFNNEKMKLKSLYKFDLGHPIYNNCISLGKYDGEKFSISYASLGGKIIIFSPNEKQNLTSVGGGQGKFQNNSSNNQSSQKSKDIVLTLNKEINSIAYGKGDFNSNKNYLFIGSPSSLMCYDVLENKTIYNKEIEDGVYCLITGSYATFQKPLVIIGGNCSLQGFDIDGEEQFWTVTRGNTLSIALNDVDDDSIQEAIVGTDDYFLAYIKKEQNISEVQEDNKVTLIYSVSNNKFIYGLENGTLGLYYRNKRVWKFNHNSKPNSVVVCDINRDNQEEVISGWSNGKVKVHTLYKGEILEELDFSKVEVSKLFWENLSGVKNNYASSENVSDNNQLIVCLANGEVWGYDFDEQQNFEKVDDLKEEYAKLQRLMNEKQVLNCQYQKLIIEVSNKKKTNQSRESNSLSSKLDVVIDLKSNNEDVS